MIYMYGPVRNDFYAYSELLTFKSVYASLSSRSGSALRRESGFKRIVLICVAWIQKTDFLRYVCRDEFGDARGVDKRLQIVGKSVLTNDWSGNMRRRGRRAFGRSSSTCSTGQTPSYRTWPPGKVHSGALGFRNLFKFMKTEARKYTGQTDWSHIHLDLFLKQFLHRIKIR